VCAQRDGEDPIDNRTPLRDFPVPAWGVVDRFQEKVRHCKPPGLLEGEEHRTGGRASGLLPGGDPRGHARRATGRADPVSRAAFDAGLHRGRRRLRRDRHAPGPHHLNPHPREHHSWSGLVYDASARGVGCLRPRRNKRGGSANTPMSAQGRAALTGGGVQIQTRAARQR